MSEEPSGIMLGGIRVLCNEFLPPDTMLVSADVYARLTSTPESREAQHQEILRRAAKFNALVKEKTGGRL